MKQIEVTTMVNMTLVKAVKILESQGFKKIRESRVEDLYLTTKINELKSDNILEILASCVLLRYLKINNTQVFKKITYKNKTYENGQFLTEEKINLNCDDLVKAENLFKALGFEKLVKVKYDVLVMKKGHMELAFQDVENLGLLLEYEHPDNFENISAKEIVKEKKKMIMEIRNYQLNVSDNYDIKKAYELIKRQLDNKCF